MGSSGRPPKSVVLGLGLKTDEKKAIQEEIPSMK